MSQKFEPLQYGKYYHIYNRAVGKENLFRQTTNYEHFLGLYDKYIEPVAETYAWCLMPNHFHFLVRIKDEEEIDYLPPKKLNPDGSGRPRQERLKQKTADVEYLSGPASCRADRVYTKKKPIPVKQFSHLFNAYTKAYNIRYKRSGALFQRPFQRIRITHEKYFRNMVWYIHNNPVHHGFVEHMLGYPWTSYQTMISVKPTKTHREKVLGWFNSKNEFQVFHRENQNIKDIIRFIIE